jgi:hypothetical protein
VHYFSSLCRGLFSRSSKYVTLVAHESSLTKNKVGTQESFSSARNARYFAPKELIRRRVLEDADGAVHIYELRERFLLRNLKDEDLLEPIIDRLPRDDWLYLLESIETNTFKDAAGEAIYSIGVELEDASLTEIGAEEDEDLCDSSKGFAAIVTKIGRM